MRRALTEPTARPLVLIVDDNDDTRDLYAEFFVYSGMRVETAVDGDHAIWKLVSLEPDVVVMDVAMPVLDGCEATKQIKAHASMRSIPVIVLTGDVTKENLRRAEAAGADAVVTKPCAPDSLLAIVKRLMTR